MFYGKIAVWLEEARGACPSLLSALASSGAGESVLLSDGAGAHQYWRLPEYGDGEPISIDYALMEHASMLLVVRVRFNWSDIGSWDAVAGCYPPDAEGNVVVGDAVLEDCSGCLVLGGDKTVSLLGLRRTMVIDTPDALLVAHLDSAQQVRRIVDRLKEHKPALLQSANTTHRPWGTYRVVEERDGYKVKEIMVKCNCALSLQYHHHRSEHWVVIEGEATVTNGDDVFVLKKNQSTFIPAGTKHRLKNEAAVPLTMIEVQTGGYLGEDDIVRLEDNYHRT